MATKWWAIASVVFTTILTSSGQIFLKSGANELEYSIPAILTNIPLIIGFTFYIVGAIILIVALKFGELSVLYPIIATSFIWVSLMSPYFFPSDSMNLEKWLGVIFIIIGVSTIGYGAAKNGN